MKLKCLIVDDEPMARSVLEQYVGQLPQLEWGASVGSGAEGLVAIQKDKFDLIFLDVNMPEMSGVQMARAIKEGPDIIFTTAHPQYAVEGFELEAIDYLVKPISFDRFFQAIQRAIKKHQVSNPGVESSSIFIRADRKDHQVPFDSIRHMEAYGDYVKIHCVDKMLLTKTRLSVLEQQLPEQSFIRLHRSHIVALKAINYIEGNHVKVGEKTIPVSEKYRKNLIGRL